MFDIEEERDEDFEEVEYLFDLTFAPGRTALSSYRLREGVEPVARLCLLARDEFGAVGGAIRCWPIRIGAAGDAALLLGPVAVHPTRQGEGLGGALIEESLARGGADGWVRVVLVGDEPYYRRFGFTRAGAAALQYPPPTNPDRLLARELIPGALQGVSGLIRRWTPEP